MKELKTLAIAALTVICAFATTLSSQSQPNHNSKPAADAWMLTPTPYLAWNKDISASTRAERNRFWDEASMSPVPLTQPGSMRVAGGSYDLVGDPDEISSTFSHRVVLTATFTGHRSVLSSSERSLYTEVTLRVDEVFEDRSGSGHPAADRDITLIIYGGTVVLQDGQAFSVKNPMASPELFIQPGHKYLFVLDYESSGDFYDYADSWDITDGTARASGPRSRYFAQEGHSAIDGVSVKQLGLALDKVLYGNDAQGRGAQK
jgi:hypothetical protein